VVNTAEHCPLAELHAAMPEDALRAHGLRLKWQGRQPILSLVEVI